MDEGSVGKVKSLRARTVIIVAVLITALIAVFLLQKHMISSVNRVSEQTALSLLSDNANQVREVLDNQLNNIWNRMEMVDSAVTAVGDMTTEEAVAYLKRSVPDAYRVVLASSDGEYIDQSGKNGYVELTEQIEPLFFENRRVCILNQEGEQDTLLLGMPITAVSVDQKKVQYLLVYFKLDSFMKLLSVESYAGDGGIRVINHNGLALFCSDNLDEDEKSYYFFKIYESADFIESHGISDSESFRTSVLNGENHAIHVITEDGKDRIISYAKVTGMDWYITIVVDYESVLGELNENILSIGWNCVLITMGVVLLAVLLVLFINMDIHKVRNEKQQLQEWNQSLECAKQIAEEALQIAEDANKAKSFFLSNVSHDLRTPMNAIVGFAELMSQNAGNPDKLREYTRKIIASSQHMLGLINDTLDMSRIESGKMTLNLSEESITGIVDGINLMIYPQMKTKGHTFDIDAHQIVHDSIIVDKVRLNQICINLLTNAAKYTQDHGHVQFKISESYASENSAHYKIVVSDNGCGMSQQFLEHIFDAFSRGSDSRNSRIPGTGLGMTITRNLVELMGGSIRVESEKGVGSTFTVEIPFRISEPRTDSKPHIQKESSLKGKHILAAEDNEVNAEVLSELLEMVGATCDICKNGREIVETFEKSESGRYDLILMDIEMPEMDGYEATRAIRGCGHAFARTIPIIAMTAKVFTKDIQDALRAGMNAHVAKPLELSALEEAVRLAGNIS